MDTTKRRQLLERLAQQAPPRLVLIEQFFDGNDDPASIGCNLIDHPGIHEFNTKLDEIARHPDVKEIYVQIAELNPGDDYWPFADTLYILGTRPADVLRNELAHLQPDTVELAASDDIPDRIRRHYEGAPVVIVWWD